MKKYITVLLSILLVFTTVPVSAFATENSAAEDAEKQEEAGIAEVTENLTIENNAPYTEVELIQAKWQDISSSKMFLLEMKKGKTYRYEVFFYTKSYYPDALLVSPSGKLYRPEQIDTTSVFVIKPPQTLSDNPNIKYSIFYITATEDGVWKLSLTPQPNEKFLCVAETAVPADWQNIKKETTMQVTALHTWYINEGLFSTQDLFLAIKERQAEENKGMQSIVVTPEEPEPVNYTRIIYVVSAIILMVCIIFSQIKKRKKKEAVEKKRQKRIKEANEALAKERALENEVLAAIMQDHEQEYENYPEEVNYYEESVKFGLQQPPVMPVFIKKEPESIKPEPTITEPEQIKETYTASKPETTGKPDNDIFNYF